MECSVCICRCFPSAALRMEEFVMDKLEKKKKDRLTPAEELGGAMVDAGNELGAGSTYGEAACVGEKKVGLTLKFGAVEINHSINNQSINFC